MKFWRALPVWPLPMGLADWMGPDFSLCPILLPSLSLLPSRYFTQKLSCPKNLNSHFYLKSLLPKESVLQHYPSLCSFSINLSYSSLICLWLCWLWLTNSWVFKFSYLIYSSSSLKVFLKIDFTYLKKLFILLKSNMITIISKSSVGFSFCCCSFLLTCLMIFSTEY